MAHQAFVTLATTDAYCRGSLVVGKCLRKHGTTRKLVVMVSPSISREARALVHWWSIVLSNVDELFEREELSAAPDPGWPDCFNSGVFVFRPSLNTYLQLLEQADLHGSFDGGDQGLLNTFFSDWATRDINKHLPFIYNLSASSLYTYLPAFHKYGYQAKIIHFLGASKPWHFPNVQKPSSKAPPWDSNRNLVPYIKLWWKEYYSQPQQNVSAPINHAGRSLQTAAQPQSQETGPEAPSSEEETLSQTLRELTFNLPASSSCHQPEEMMRQYKLFTCLQAVEESKEEEIKEEKSEEEIGEEKSEEESDEERRRRWEEGRADYMGKDAFENIQRKLNLFLN
uniref:glycogenin glucosyltransferase n=1 Tax=Astyanax mexicanus TaxID=7994 RepID=A0A8B9H1M3_ASTMX